ncbi:metallophosphoesterase [uncultured Tissierella sp.]|uniref:metallophosphoesterase n=1 Tax=uncultured Tissierella sp. TaxID=448160 RepID=UPI00280519D4|nr:metallophosphoesterase [uncultured Tissierella sp.]MDU5083523.1 metallophosphoesterase [Bacillota bacterium]
MKLLKIISIIVTLIVFVYIYNYDQISKFRVRDIRIDSKKVRNNLKITQISDFHSNDLIDLEKMEDKIKKFDPDIIVLTGDIIDSNDIELDAVIKLFETLSRLDKNIYFVQGNHEARQELYKDLKDEMKRLEIIILEDNSATITVNNEKINITGLKFHSKSREYNEVIYYQEAIKDLNLDYYNVLLRHSPNNVENILSGKEDLILSGHTHGGQIRLPLIGAVVAPGQGFFPEYDKGIFRINDTILYIDSGLGNSAAPIRAFNPVQISNIIIEPEK